MNLFYQPRIDENILYLDEEESRHCIKVLRKRQGDLIRITDGKGYFYDARITKDDPHQCIFEIQQRIEEKKKNYFIRIAIAPVKNSDRLEWFVEKSVEIGVDRITLLACKHSEKTFVKTDRLKKVAISAMKQSVKASVPIIDNIIPFNDFIESEKAVAKFIAFVDAENPIHLKDAAKSDQNYCVLIGPEGDFSDEELSSAVVKGYTKVSLGHSRLRTETAGIVACLTLNLINT